jgi:hypothetical protein
VDKALTMLEECLLWAVRSRTPAFVDFGRKIRKKISGIEAAMVHTLSNALIESTNNKAPGAAPHALGLQTARTSGRACPARPRWLAPLPGRRTG